MLFLNCKDTLNSDRGFHVYCVCLFSIVCDVGYLLSLFKTLKTDSQFSQPISSSVVKATATQNPDLTTRTSAVTSPNCWWLADFMKLTKFRLILFVTFKTPNPILRLKPELLCALSSEYCDICLEPSVMVTQNLKLFQTFKIGSRRGD